MLHFLESIYICFIVSVNGGKGGHPERALQGTLRPCTQIKCVHGHWPTPSVKCFPFRGEVRNETLERHCQKSPRGAGDGFQLFTVCGALSTFGGARPDFDVRFCNFSRPWLRHLLVKNNKQTSGRLGVSRCGAIVQFFRVLRETLAGEKQ